MKFKNPLRQINENLCKVKILSIEFFVLLWCLFIFSFIIEYFLGLIYRRIFGGVVIVLSISLLIELFIYNSRGKKK